MQNILTRLEKELENKMWVKGIDACYLIAN